MHIAALLLSTLSGASIGGMAAASVAVFLAKALHREELANRIARSVAKATWALRMGGGLSE